MARNQYFNQLVSPVSSWHREQHDGIAYLDADFISICPACAKPLFIADLIYKVIKGLSENESDNSKIENEVKKDVINLCSSFPIYDN